MLYCLKINSFLLYVYLILFTFFIITRRMPSCQGLDGGKLAANQFDLHKFRSASTLAAEAILQYYKSVVNACYIIPTVFVIQ